MAGGTATTTNLSFSGAGRLGANAGSIPVDKEIVSSVPATSNSVKSVSKSSQEATINRIKSTAASVAARFGR